MCLLFVQMVYGLIFFLGGYKVNVCFLCNLSRLGYVIVQVCYVFFEEFDKYVRRVKVKGVYFGVIGLEFVIVIDGKNQEYKFYINEFIDEWGIFNIIIVCYEFKVVYLVGEFQVELWVYLEVGFFLLFFVVILKLIVFCV